MKNTSLSKEERSLIRTFTYPTSRVFVSETLKNSRPTQIELSSLEISSLTDELFDSSVAFMKQTIAEFKSTSSTITSSSISKSGPFEELLTKQLVERYRRN